MSSDSLFSLWKLHQIDSAIVDIRARAAALDPGRKLAAEIEALKEAHAEKEGEAKALAGEAADVELKQKGLDEKLKRFDKELYGGKVVNPREVQAIEKEVTILKRQRGELDSRLLELWETLPPAKKSAEDAKRVVVAKQAELGEHQKKVLAAKAQLESGFREASAKRQDAAKGIDAGLLARYDSIRGKHGGLGMSRITKEGSCELCGTLQPRKTVENVKDGRVVICEACHRILYWSEGVV